MGESYLVGIPLINKPYPKGDSEFRELRLAGDSESA